MTKCSMVFIWLKIFSTFFFCSHSIRNDTIASDEHRTSNSNIFRSIHAYLFCFAFACQTDRIFNQQLWTLWLVGRCPIFKRIFVENAQLDHFELMFLNDFLWNGNCTWLIQCDKWPQHNLRSISDGKVSYF